MRRRGVDRLSSRDDADVDGYASRQIRYLVHGHNLVRQFADGADTFLERSAGMGRPAEHLEARKYAAFAPGDDIAAGPAGFGIEEAAGGACDPLDDRSGGWRGNLLIAGNEPNHGCGSTAEALYCRQHKGVHDQARLHVGHAWTIGPAIFDPKGAAGRLALRKDGVAMAHQHDRLLVGTRRLEAHVDGGGEGGVRLGGDDQPVFLEKAHQSLPDRLDAGFVVAAAVNVDELTDELEHGVLLRAEPVRELGFVRRQFGHHATSYDTARAWAASA